MFFPLDKFCGSRNGSPKGRVRNKKVAGGKFFAGAGATESCGQAPTGVGPRWGLVAQSAKHKVFIPLDEFCGSRNGSPKGN